MNIRFEENPNPSAKIAFVIWTAFHFNVCKNILKELSDIAEIVLCDTWYSSLWERGPDHLYRTISFIEENKIHWRVLTDLTKHESSPEIFFSKYAVIVSPLAAPPLTSLPLPDPWFLNKKSVRLPYAAGSKGLMMFAPWSAYFDVTLSYGEHMHEYFKLFSESHIVGNPKFDDWFLNTVNIDKINKISIQLDTSKKTLLYLPTHSNISSLYSFAEILTSLSSDYNILIKFHYLNEVTESNLVTTLKNKKTVFLFDDFDDILALFKVTDIVITDYSSASLDALLIDKPLVILDTFANKEVGQKHNSGEEFNGYWYSGGTVYHDSAGAQLRKLVKKIGGVVEINERTQLIAAIENVKKHRHLIENDLHELKDKLFAFKDGNSGKRAARIIRELLQKEKPKPPFLGLAARSYAINLLKTNDYILDKKMAEIKAKDGKIYNLELELEEVKKIKIEKGTYKKIQKIIKYFF